MKKFSPAALAQLYQPPPDSAGEDNGQLTIIGGSKLFHGAPLLSLKVASRIVDMVFFASPCPRMGEVAAKLKSSLFSFIWVPWAEVGEYLKKSEAALIGPGLMRYHSSRRKNLQKLDGAGEKTKRITHDLLRKFPRQRWIIDAGSLQVMAKEEIPEGAILTPNYHEFKLLFGQDLRPLRNNLNKLEEKVKKQAQKYRCIIVLKGPKTLVVSPQKTFLVEGGNPGLTKGGTGDVLAGLTAALATKNDPLLAAAAASFVTKAAADQLYQEVGPYYSADDLANQIPKTFYQLTQGDITVT